MKFRPLSIDYHFRAQEIIATERDIRARRATLCTLPNPSPPCNHSRCRHRHWNGDPDDDGTRSSLCDAYINAGEKERTSALSNADDENYVSMRQEGKRSGSEEDHQSAQLGAINRDSARQRKRICEIINTLGPAVHPSECAFRPVAPVTKGPIRGRKLPLVRSLLSSLEAITQLYSDHVDKALDGVVGALESGRWRFDSPINADVFAFASSDDITQNRQRDTTFLSTMKIEYSSTSSILYSSPDPYQEMEASLKSQIWTHHLTNLPMPTTTCRMRHEPDDLAAIYSCTSQRSFDTSNFASAVTISFGPHLRWTKNSSQGGIQSRKKFATGYSASAVNTKPHFTIGSYDNSQLNNEEEEKDYSSRLGTVPFTRFLEKEDIFTSKYLNNMTLENSIPRFTIRLDPDFDPLLPTSMPQKPSTRDLLIPLDKMCNMSSVSALLRLPSRFEESHPSPNGLSCFFPHQTHNRFEFITNILDKLKESIASDQTLASLLAIHEGRASMNGINFLPQKIRLDTDIETPLFVHKGDVRLKSNDDKRPVDLTLEMNFFSRTMLLTKSQYSFNAGSGQRNERPLHDRFIDSSSRVIGVTVLENVSDSSNATGIFLPQSIAHNNTNEECVTRKVGQTPQRKSIPSAVVSAVRSENRAWFQQHCSEYPVSTWFGKNEINSNMKSLTELDSSVLSAKREMFCRNAKLRSKIDGARMLLLTGCSSRRNVESIYSYRGFLTNQIVDPNVFQHRYRASLQVKKFLTTQSSQPMRVETSTALFTQMNLDVFADSDFRHSNETNHDGLKRSAPYNFRLKTKRRGQHHTSSYTTNDERTISRNIGPKFLIDLSTIEELATRFRSNCSNSVTGTDPGPVDDILAIKALGESSLKVRGEFLHLVMKARDLTDATKTFLAEVALATRGRVSSQHVLFQGVGNDVKVNRVDVPTCQHNVDLTLQDKHKSTRKRASGWPIDEERKCRKMRKKEKRKRKKDRKRKRRGDDSIEVLQLRETAEEMPHTERDKSITAMSNNHIMHVAVPSIPLGMTPIHPPKKIELRRSALNSSDEMAKSDDDNVRKSTNSEYEANLTATSAGIKTSPDSVANLNSLRDANVSQQSVDNANITHSRAHSHSDDRQMEEVPISDNHSEVYVDTSSLTTSNLIPQERAQWNLLTSENFLESFGEVVASLASGAWRKSLTQSEIAMVHDTPKEIVVCDCPLLDNVGVDIELSDNSAIIVKHLSAWSERGESSRAFIRRVVLLAASGRYNSVHVVLCLDVDMSSALSGDMITLQNAVDQQSGCPADVTFEFVSPRSLTASIALKLISVSDPHESNQLAKFVLDENVRERARFLLMLVPTMTVHMALKCMGYSSSEIESGEAMHSLFVLAKRTPRDLFSQKVMGILPKSTSDQLWLAVNVDISLAY